MDLFAVGSVLATRYRVLGELGRGGMGVVYSVEHVHTGQELALKVLSISGGLTAAAVERFKREARAPARIKSEHVVTVTDADVLPELGGMPFFVMERLRGRDLEAEVTARGGLSYDEIVLYLRQAADALDRSHALGIVHRDLKPENLFLHRREGGTTCLKILDFGISKSFEDERGAKAASLTGPGAFVGTPLYMAPEQASDGPTVTRATDVWAIGLVVVRLLTGENYWTASSVPELLAALLRDALVMPSARWPWLPPEFDAWFARSCDRDPRRRFASVGEQVAELERVFLGAPSAREAARTPLLASDAPSAREVASTHGARSSVGRPLFALAAMGVGVAVMAGVAVSARLLRGSADGGMGGVGAGASVSADADAGANANAGAGVNARANANADANANAGANASAGVGVGVNADAGANAGAGAGANTDADADVAPTGTRIEMSPQNGVAVGFVDEARDAAAMSAGARRIGRPGATVHVERPRKEAPLEGPRGRPLPIHDPVAP